VEGVHYVIHIEVAIEIGVLLRIGKDIELLNGNKIKILY